MSSVVKCRRNPSNFDMELPTNGSRRQENMPAPDNSNTTLSMYAPAALLQLSLVEFMLAIAYGHKWGGFVAVLGFVQGLALMWNRSRGSSRIWTNMLMTFFLIYISLLVLVRAVSINGWGDIFPESSSGAAEMFPHKCPSSKLLGCARVASTSSHPNASAVPPMYRAYIQDATKAVVDWVDQEAGAAILVKRQEPVDSILTAGKSKCTVYMHVRVVTFFMGFADDLFVNIECFKAKVGTVRSSSSSSHVVISAQSQLRLGVGDLGVNGRRIQRLFEFLSVRLSGVENDCTARLSTTSN